MLRSSNHKSIFQWGMFSSTAGFLYSAGSLYDSAKVCPLNVGEISEMAEDSVEDNAR